jgi:CubicO group peptidase (beta-lactamase class C family)
VLVAAVALGFGRSSPAQGLTYYLFERYLEALRQQSAIPGLSAAILQNGRIVWEAELGRVDLDANLAPTRFTPYVIGDVSQVFAATLLLDRCVDHSYLRTTDAVVRWWPPFPDTTSTVAHLLAHATVTGAYHYDLTRYAAVTHVIEQCAQGPYRKLLATDVFDRLGMASSVPGQAMATPTSDDRILFDPATLGRYASVLSRVAVPYHVDSRGHATRSDFAGQSLDAARGIVTTLDDFARFDAALADGGIFHETVQAATTKTAINGVPLPTGLGWFVQTYDGEPLVWQFGLVRDAYSSLVVKLPRRGVTLVLLANSDGLTAPFSLANGDLTASPFARVFLHIFGI